MLYVVVMSKYITFSKHANEQMIERGALESEVAEAIQAAEWTSAREGRMECRKNFEYNKEWKNKFYTTKQVRPIFKELAEEIIVITIYIYYF